MMNRPFTQFNEQTLTRILGSRPSYFQPVEMSRAPPKIVAAKKYRLILRSAFFLKRLLKPSG